MGLSRRRAPFLKIGMNYLYLQLLLYLKYQLYRKYHLMRLSYLHLQLLLCLLFLMNH